jgi:hypothetical protein
MVLRALVQKFPKYKQAIGDILIDYMLTDGLFDVPLEQERH